MKVPAWEKDWFLSRTLRALDADLKSISSLANPLKILLSRGRTTVAFDYAFFVLLRSLCQALLLDGNIDGAVISAYLYQVGLNLDRAKLEIEAASVLNRACELRTRYTLFEDSSRRAAFFYQKAVNISLIHEKTHSIFDQSTAIRDHWLRFADATLAYVGDDQRSASFFPDRVVREDIQRTCALFRSSSGLLEEVACDLYALENAIFQELEQQPGLAALYADGYLVSARLMVLALYMGRTIGRAADLAVRGIEGRAADAKSPAKEHQSFLSEMRLRIQIINLRALILRNDLGLPRFDSNAATSLSPVEADRLPFDRLTISLQVELEDCRQDDSLFRAVALARGMRKFELAPNNIDNTQLIELYLEQYWN